MPGPTLLDRLIDSSKDDGSSEDWPAESVAAAICRDLEALLNTTNLETTLRARRGSLPRGSAKTLEGFARARKSVLNFGTTALTGWFSTSMKKPQLEQIVREAIETFEPRLRLKKVICANPPNMAADDAIRKITITARVGRDGLERDFETRLNLARGSASVDVR